MPEASSNTTPAPKKTTSDRGTKFRSRTAALKLTPTAVLRLRALMESDSGPKLIRVGVRNKGCAGMSYHLEYISPKEAGRFDERVKQDGVEVLIDSKALFSIIGSEMDWQEDRLSAKFVFNNPNVKEACGCGESFLT
uniref:Iron-sulfur assembly protein 1 n=2 Tax=Kalmanozyma brasiliensis (strain GHG001) TaxID=1365824 RepID=V5EX45_KALBG